MQILGQFALGAAVVGAFFATAVLLGRRWGVPIGWPPLRPQVQQQGQAQGQGQTTIPPARKRVGGIVVGAGIALVGVAVIVLLTAYLGHYLLQAGWFGAVGGLVIAPALAALAVALTRSVRP